MKQITIKLDENLQIPINWSTRRRSIALKVSRQGKIELYAPSQVPLHFLEKFVVSKREWLQNQITKSHHHKFHSPLGLFNKQVGDIWHRGERTQIKIGIIRPGSPQFEFAYSSESPAHILYHHNGKSTVDTLYRHYKRWMKKEAEQDYQARLDHWSGLMSLKYTQLKVTAFRARWGDCNSEGLIRINWKSMACPDWVRDSLCIHELSHLKYMNHSAQFYELVCQFDLREKEARLWMKQNAQVLDY
jgi:predicted metal-dependent hydrolase